MNDGRMRQRERVTAMKSDANFQKKKGKKKKRQKFKNRPRDAHRHKSRAKPNKQGIETWSYGDQKNNELTGKTTGIPPLTGFEPSRSALSLNQRFSCPLVFQDMTVAP